jgi:tRNA threonylcarbamoyladenosine modification (KEOPS) complex Cgi121 subunit
MHNPVFPAFGPLSGAAKTPLGPHHVNIIIIAVPLSYIIFRRPPLKKSMTDFALPGGRFRLYCFPELPSPTPILTFLKESQPNVCLIDPRTILSPLQIQVAVLNALSLQTQGKMEAKTIYLEILRCLSPDARLSGAFKYIAITATSTAALAVTFEETLTPIPGLDGAVSADQFFGAWKPDLGLIRQIYMINDEALKTYSYEQIVVAALSIAASDLIRVHAL